MQNREIKIRTWSAPDKVMHTDDSHISFVDGTGYLWELAHPTHAMGALYKPSEIDCPVMQYTGLKDKNGTEIYEGDIVEGRARVRGLHVSFIGRAAITPTKGVVFAQENTEMEFSDVILCRVIGNIHENPEIINS